MDDIFQALGYISCFRQWRVFVPNIREKSVDVNDGILAQNLCGKIMIHFYEAPHSIFCFDSSFWKFLETLDYIRIYSQ